MSASRLEAFSDGVLAIVITLLILVVKVPSVPPGHLAGALRDQWPRHVAYLVSFGIIGIIGIIWLNHYATMQLLARTDHGTQVLNLLLLLPVSVLPWPTALFAECASHASPDDARLAVVIYGGTSTLMAVTFNIL